MSNWTKGQGAKIGIKFNQPILPESISGSQNAFAIAGQQRRHIGGDLINGDYQVDVVEMYPSREIWSDDFSGGSFNGLEIGLNGLVIESTEIAGINEFDDTKDGTTLSGSAYARQGNSVTFKQSGVLTKVKIKPGETRTLTLKIYKDNTLPVIQQIDGIVGTANTWATVELQTPIMIELNDVYTFDFVPSSNSRFYYSSGLHDGTLWKCNGAIYNQAVGSSGWTGGTVAMGFVFKDLVKNYESSGTYIAPPIDTSILPPDGMHLRWTEEMTVAYELVSINGTAFADSTYLQDTADKAFNLSLANSWRSGITTPEHWIKYDLGVGQSAMVDAYSIFTPGNQLMAQYNNYLFQGSHDDLNWDTLDSGVLLDCFLTRVLRTFNNETTYRYYRLFVDSTGAPDDRMLVTDFKLLKKITSTNVNVYTATNDDANTQPVVWVKKENGDVISNLTELYLWLQIEILTESNKISSIVAELWFEEIVDPTKILLTMKPLKRFHNAEGNLTVSYDMGIGVLAGAGGGVVSFTEQITPTDLAPVPNPYQQEIINLAIHNYEILLERIYHYVVGDGPYPTNDKRSRKWAIEPNPPAEEGVEKGTWGNANNEKISLSIQNFSINLIHVDMIDP